MDDLIEEDLLAAIERRRGDPDFMERLRHRIKEDAPALERLRDRCHMCGWDAHTGRCRNISLKPDDIDYD